MTRQNKDLAIIYAISFVDLFAVGLSFPLFSNHLRDLGASHFIVGLIGSLYSGLQVLSGPFIGSWSDVRDRKSVMLVTLAVCSLCYSLLGLTDSFLVIIILRFLLGIVKHTQTLCKVIITDLLPPENRAGAFGRSAAFGSIGFIAGPLLGGHISELPNGFSYACFFTGVLFIINIVLCLQLTNTTYTSKAQKQSRKEEPFTTKIKYEFMKSISDFTDINWNALWDSLLLRFLFGLSLTFYFSQQSIYLQEQFKLSQRYIGYTISYFSTVGTVSAFTLHYITKYCYKSDTSCVRRLTHFFVLTTICFIGLYIAPGIEIFLLLLAPLSFSSTVLRIVSMELLLKKSENTHRGSLSGSANSIMSVARFITPITSGIISDKFGEHSLMLFAALPTLIGTIISFRMMSKQPKMKTR